ncbi:MAG: alpha/beta hydrolase [Bacteroidota bacterium]
MSPASPDHSADPVLLLHGLGRTRRSMQWLARQVERAGFRTVNESYPSTCHPIGTLVDDHVRPLFEAAHVDGRPVHAVTHSLGGILVRAYAERYGLPDGSRVVMLAPPNAGSPVADLLRERWPFTAWCGPALRELGTGPGSVPRRLGPVGFALGVVAGERNLFPFGRTLGGASDGLVAVDSAKVEGMADFVVVPAGHSLIMRRRIVAEHVVHFLRQGRFESG